MRGLPSEKPHGSPLSFFICFVILLGACIFSWVLFGDMIDKLFTALGDAVSRAGTDN